MPPRKRRKITFPEKPGIARQFLNDNYSSVPSEKVKNGHVLFLYLNCIKSVGDTITLLQQKLDGDWKITRNQIHSLVNRSLKKWTGFDNASVKRKFQELCDADFPLTPSETRETPPDKEEGRPQEDPLPVPPIASTSAVVVEPELPRISQRLDSTPRKQKLRKQLAFTSKGRSSEKKVYKAKVQALRKQLRAEKSVTKKYLKQMIKRLKTRNTSLKVKNSLLNKELTASKRAHQAMLTYNRKKNVNIPATKHAMLKTKLNARDAEIADLQTQNILLQEEVDVLSSPTIVKSDGKSYSGDMRMMVFDCITSNVPTKSIPKVIDSISKRLGTPLSSVPHRTSVEMMVRELGALSDIQAGLLLDEGTDLTLGFDATTQEGIHVNSIHCTSKDQCHILGVDQLPGGTADDYAGHISDTVNRIASVYSTATDLSYDNVRQNIISNVANTMTDRAAVNHATVVKIEEMWGKKLTELNCHLHPLDSIATACRTSLKDTQGEPGKVFGRDCIAANLIVAMNKIRFKDGKGDPKSFVSFLENEGLPKGLIEHYRGNRLHILFDLSGKYFEHYERFVNFLTTSVLACPTLQKAVQTDFCTMEAKIQFQVLGLIGKLLSGPWMTMFYTSADTEINHVDAIKVVENVIESIKAHITCPLDTLTASNDFFGTALVDDERLKSLRQQPLDPVMFSRGMKSCLEGAVKVLERQYAKYFGMTVNEDLRMTTESARSHNMDAEEVMGMFSAAKAKAPAATLCYHSCRIRAQKNKTVEFIESLEEKEKDRLIRLCMSIGRSQREVKRRKLVELKVEVQKRLASKVVKKAAKERNKIEKVLRKANLDIPKEFPDLSQDDVQIVDAIMKGRIVGQTICHLWYDEDSNGTVMYNGKVEKLNKRQSYVIAYWKDDETYDISVMFDVTKHAAAADFLCGDLKLA